MAITRIGLDLAKNVFQVHGVDERGKTVLRKTLRRSDVSRFFAHLPPCVVGMEACGGAHYWAREAGGFGHQARLISPQFVKPYVKSNKSDRNDAEAICEATGRPSMRFVPIKSDAQLTIQATHRIRSRLIASRTALVNQIRGILAEFGVVVARNLASLRRRLPEILDSEPGYLDAMTRSLIIDLREELAELDKRVGAYDRRIKQLCSLNEACQRLCRIEGIGPITATALVAAAGDAQVFKNGRQFAAWLGLVPRQHSSGGRVRLLGISKRGDRYLRTLLIHGARSALVRCGRKTDARSRWLQKLRERCHPNVAAVALANKNARIAWVLLRRGEDYDRNLGAAMA
jgi:transposase